MDFAAFAAPEPTETHFQFRTPSLQNYSISSTEAHAATSIQPQWIKVHRDGSTNVAESGNEIVIQLQNGKNLDSLIQGHSLTHSRMVARNTFILQAPDALTAASEAHRLATIPGVLASSPVMRQPVALHGPYAPQPTDFYYFLEWWLEHRNGDGSSAGVDLNVRAAWSYTTGQGVTIAIADTGIETNHVELAHSVIGAPHYNFVEQNSNAAPVNRSFNAAHGTEVAGVIASARNTARIVGVAPDATLASWGIYDSDLTFATDEQLMEMYQYQSNVVSVQNHSWGFPGDTQNPVPLLQQIGISNAVNFGRSGLGSVMVRSSGNDRMTQANADDSGFPNDPQVIAVAAVNVNGRAASYSTPGSCILVSAPSGDPTTAAHGLFTTDLIGTDGENQFGFFPPNQDLSDYAFYNPPTGNDGFAGTSASAPQIAGLAAMMLSVNPNLGYRDVQQILVLASRHFDFADPELGTNGAGFLISNNDGFGVPDAGVAVRLAQNWSNRPPATNIVLTSTDSAEIPDDGLRLLVSGEGVPTNLASIHTLPAAGAHADNPTVSVPLVDVGWATGLIGMNLTNKGALIQRGTNTFAEKISFAAQAGAVFAVVYNFSTNVDPSGGDGLSFMAGTDFNPIPAVFIGNSDGEALKALFLTNASAAAQIHLTYTNYTFNVTNTLLCEHVGVHVMTDHPRRSDVRITVVSPSGTRSVLERYNLDPTAGPVDWTYYTTHDFFESSAGQWTVYFNDEGPGETGTVHQVDLILQGVPIVDTDHDGLDDNWEMAHFGNLNQGPGDDPDRDGYSNMREQLMGTDPNVPVPIQPNFSGWNTGLGRLSWAGNTNFSYDVFNGTNATSLTLVTNISGTFPETEWFMPVSGVPQQFFRVRSVPKP